MAKKKIWERVMKTKSFKLEVLGHRLLVKPLDAEQETSIELLDDTKDSDQRAQTYGVVLQIGDLAFKDLSGNKMHMKNYDPKSGTQIGETEMNIGKAWCQVGDTILFHPYSYARIRDPITMEYRDDAIIVNDQDVYAVVTNLEAYEDEVNRLREKDQKAAAKKAENTKSKW